MQFNIVYKTTNLINGKIYVGKHIQYDTSAFDGYLGSGHLIKRAIRDVYQKDMEEVLVEGEEAYQKLEERLRAEMVIYFFFIH